jgi:hypothetical protein
MKTLARVSPKSQDSFAGPLCGHDDRIELIEGDPRRTQAIRDGAPREVAVAPCKTRPLPAGGVGPPVLEASQPLVFNEDLDTAVTQQTRRRIVTVINS